MMRVRDLVRHAARHGYLVASFKVHGAEEAQAVVNAAEAARAPAIIAVDEQGPSLLRQQITLAIAESLASSSSVPIAVEVVSPAREPGLVSSRTDSIAVNIIPAVANASSHASAGESTGLSETEAEDREMWFSSPVAAAGFARAAQAGYRIGLVAADASEAGLRPAALRKQFEELQARDRLEYVVDGDLPWPNATFRSLPGFGVTKVNFDKRLGLLMAKAYRRAAQKSGDHHRPAMEEAFTVLTEEVVEWLRRAGGSGRAADVMACVPDNESEDARAHDFLAARGIARFAMAAPRDAVPPVFSGRSALHGGHASFFD